jgi:hypothetical protein
MNFQEYKEKYACSKDFESWDHLAASYRDRNHFFRMETVLCKLADRYAVDSVYAYMIDQIPPEQRKMFDALSLEWSKTGDVARKSGKLSGNIDAQMTLMMFKGAVLSKIEESGGKMVKFWKRKPMYLDDGQDL